MQELVKALSQLSGTKVALVCVIIFAGFIALNLFDKWLEKHINKVAPNWSERAKKYARKGVCLALGMTVLLLAFHLLGADMAGSVVILAAVLMVIFNAGKTLVTNWTAGFCIMSGKLFKVGEHIIAGGHEGTVRNIGINNVEIETKEGMRVFLPNSAIAYGSISVIDPDDPYRMQMKIAFSNMYAPDQACALLKNAVAAIPTVIRKESISVGISSTVVSMTNKPNGRPSLEKGCMEYQCSFWCLYKDRVETTFAFNNAVATLYSASETEQ